MIETLNSWGFLGFPQSQKTARRQDHTAFFRTQTTAFVIRRHRVTRIPPRVRDDREPPLSSGETSESLKVICPTG
jgi:hypothetical protein